MIDQAKRCRWARPETPSGRKLDYLYMKNDAAWVAVHEPRSGPSSCRRACTAWSSTAPTSSCSRRCTSPSDRMPPRGGRGLARLAATAAESGRHGVGAVLAVRACSPASRARRCGRRTPPPRPHDQNIQGTVTEQRPEGAGGGERRHPDRAGAARPATCWEPTPTAATCVVGCCTAAASRCWWASPRPSSASAWRWCLACSPPTRGASPTPLISRRST